MANDILQNLFRNELLLKQKKYKKKFRIKSFIYKTTHKHKDTSILSTF